MNRFENRNFDGIEKMMKMKKPNATPSVCPLFAVKALLGFLRFFHSSLRRFYAVCEGRVGGGGGTC
ncbi:hypothetical protein GUITHDRAFT_155734 [Guillardia theta CCMP2712]|uniref:Uncharacterized protein n=1 Tax=Guillardia theta (strain CCMP2712) TaxID=905079 RepID=L1IF35_GUITC|nr:hypothetical protein GUITHDRAFT_155734 [Guillardia theta CCMP2712]EKX34465.1 hypothetical protein GUITHDRAFT_155734 [Guillardia theta CCMP2712]|eukprot:XP_005821445.1 hypothetical protein GUITHDRAFT_155734 [Guillardia theta CCMP2712]